MLFSGGWLSRTSQKLVLGQPGFLLGSCPDGRPLEPEALGWIGLFSKWKNILLLLFSLSLQSKMGKSLQTDKLKGEYKIPSSRQPDSACTSQCLDKDKPLEGEWNPSPDLN